MLFADYVARTKDWARLGDLEEYGRVKEKGREYPLLRLVVPGRRWLTVTAGFHGDEVAGPLTLLEHMPEIVAYAREREVGLRVYPCVNPSGFEGGTRYNASGERPNNDLLRYEVAPGHWQGELEQGQAFLRWEVFTGGPQETRALRADLESQSAPTAALDLHQDRYLKGALAYAYTFGDRRVYRPLLEKTAQHARLATDTQVDDRGWHTDGQGLLELHDGSVTDYFFRRGTPYTAALETTGDTPLEACHQVNLVWIRGFVDLCRSAADAEPHLGS